MSERDLLLEKAKNLLLHPNFNKLSLEQMQQVYRAILASGVTKAEIEEILINSKPKPRIEFSYLEKLPKDIFKYMVQVGEIQGKDLIKLCNSSKILRGYCLADLHDQNGQVLRTQDIYRTAIERDGTILAPNQIPSEYYIRRYGKPSKIKVLNYITYGRIMKEVYDLPGTDYIEISATANLRILLDKNGNLSTAGNQLISGFRNIKTMSLSKHGKYLLAIDNTGKLNISKEFDPSAKYIEKLYTLEYFKVRDSKGRVTPNVNVKFKKIKPANYEDFLLWDTDNSLYMFSATDTSSLRFVMNNVKFYVRDNYEVVYKNDGTLSFNKRTPILKFEGSQKIVKMEMSKLGPIILCADNNLYSFNKLYDLNHIHSNIKDFSVLLGITIYAVDVGGHAMRISLGLGPTYSGTGDYSTDMLGDTEIIPEIVNAKRVEIQLMQSLYGNYDINIYFMVY